MKKKLDFLISLVLNFFIIIVCVMILMGIYYIVQIKFCGKKYADIFGYTFFQVATGSMSPTLEIGDVIIVKETNSVYENEIIVYEEDNAFITHRLIRIEDNMLITKGDANNSEDKEIDKECVVGKVVFSIPRIGILRELLLQPKVILLIVILNVLIGTLLFTGKAKDE